MKESQTQEPKTTGRRRGKVIGFVIAEASALLLLFLTGTIAVTAPFTNSILILSINVLTIAAAVAVAIIPILFFAVTPVLPGQR